MNDKRQYPTLSKDQKDKISSEHRKWLEEGNANYKWHDSLLGFDPGTYSATWPGLPEGEKPLEGIPGELLSYGYNGTDAYALALLATDTFLAPDCLLTIKCAFEREDTGRMWLVYSSSTDFLLPELFGDRVAVFLTVFGAALVIKGIQFKDALFCEKVGARATFGYPGAMLYEQSVLARLPNSNWPVANRSFKVTSDLRTKAKQIAHLIATSDQDTI